MNTKSVTCSFTMDREIYNAYKSIISKNGENVKGNIVRYMMEVIRYETPNIETIQALKEVEEMEKNPSAYKGYSSVEEMMRDILE